MIQAANESICPSICVSRHFFGGTYGLRLNGAWPPPSNWSH